MVATGVDPAFVEHGIVPLRVRAGPGPAFGSWSQASKEKGLAVARPFWLHVLTIYRISQRNGWGKGKLLGGQYGGNAVGRWLLPLAGV